MNLSEKEQTFLVRGLDKATTPDETDTCAKNFFKELRKRGIDGYRFVDQMDYAEYEREIDEESAKSNQAWDAYYKQQAAGSAAQDKAQKTNANSFPGASGAQGARGHTPQPESPLRPGKGNTNAERASWCANQAGDAGRRLTWFLLLASFGSMFLITHNFIATLILGWLLTCVLYAFRWLRRILAGLIVLCGLVVVWAVIAPKPTPGVSSAHDRLTEQTLERQRYADEYTRTHPASEAANDATTQSTVAGIPTPTPKPNLEQTAIQLDATPFIPVTGQPAGVAPTAAPVTFQDLSPFLSHPQEQVSAPRAELVKLPPSR